MASAPLFGEGLVQSEPHGTERREHARHPVNLRVMVAIGKTILHGRAENLSPGGAGLRLEEPLAEGTAVTVRFLTPHLEKFHCIDVAGKASYTTLTSGSPPYRVGLKFVGLDIEARRRIGALIHE